MAEIIRVGVIGLSASGGWAAQAHLPALQHLAGFELTGLSASSPQAARAASEAYGVPHAFDSAESLATSDAVDMVVVTVKVPEHRELLAPALDAGKIVLCEWPLAIDAVEAAALADAARAPAFVGLQARSAPSIRYLRDLVADGYVGTVLSTTMIGSGGNWGATVDPRNAYTLDPANGATLLTIPFGHASDALKFVLGDFAAMHSTLATRRDEVVVKGTHTVAPTTAPDQVAVTGRLAGGAVATVHYRGGVCAGTNFSWEINGTEGDLLVNAVGTGNVQLEALTLRGSRGGAPLEALVVPDRYVYVSEVFARESPRAYNVACAYEQIRSDVTENTTLAPTFAEAADHHRFLEAIAAHSAS